MNFFTEAFKVILYQPLFNALILLYEYLPGHDFGLAVIALTVLIKIILYPLGIQAIRSQKNLSDLQPKIEEIQRKHKDDKEKQARATMELYKKEKINPFSGCLPLLIQLPILLALFQVFWKGFGAERMIHLYSFVPDPGQIDLTFLGILDLAAPSIVLAFLAGITQFIQTKMMTPTASKKKLKEGTAKFSDMLQKQMLYFFPIFTVFILWKLPAAIGLYWIATSLFTIIQQRLILKPKTIPAKI